MLLVYSKIGILEPELGEYASRTAFALEGCDFAASSRATLQFEIAILETEPRECASREKSVLKKSEKLFAYC